jgi:DNA-binding MarR family transcriptional regulator
MAVKWQSFNVNSTVRVKLTDHGRKILRRRHEQLERQLNRDLPYHSPVEDAEGWSRWQLWYLMNTFGTHLTLATPTNENPFALDIEFEVY